MRCYLETYMHVAKVREIEKKKGLFLFCDGNEWFVKIKIMTIFINWLKLKLIEVSI